MSIALTIGITEPIGEWRSLVNTIKAWTNRDDWTDTQVTEFVAIAEARINRVLRHPEMEEIVSTTLLVGNNDLPIDFLAMRSIYANNYALNAMTPVALVSTYGSATGQPLAYTIMGSNPRKIRLAPMASAAVTMVYYKKIVGVDENNADNWLLNEHPDLYLWGSLLAAEAFLANDERLPLWKSAYDEALAELMQAGVADRYGSGPLTAPTTVQVSGVRA